MSSLATLMFFFSDNDDNADEGKEDDNKGENEK